MKKIITLSIIAFLSGMSAMNAQQASGPRNQDKSVLIYSEEDEALIYKTNPQSNNSEIMIESLPGYDTEPVPVEIQQNKKGSFTFTKHPSLILPEYYSVVIMDSLTGESFDLKTADSYTFDVTKVVFDRFMLLMAKSKTQFTSMN